MTQEELINMLKVHEWRDIEFKEAQTDVPRNVYETVSAFANTDGGHLVFGVKKAGKRYALADHLRARFDERDQSGDQVGHREEDLVTAQVTQSSQDLSTGQVKPLESLTDSQWKIMLFCDVPRKLTGIMDHLGAVNRGYFKANHIEPLLKGGVLVMTNPDKPRSSNQRYVITEAGVRLKVARMAMDSGKNEEAHGKA
jgi:ATP-dependent DNA helicase RecG